MKEKDVCRDGMKEVVYYASVGERKKGCGGERRWKRLKKYIIKYLLSSSTLKSNLCLLGFKWTLYSSHF